MNIAFIGLGRMGAPMARNLLRAGHRLTVYNRTREKSEVLSGEGARVADSAAGVVRECEAAITMLANDNAVVEVLLGERGILSALPRGAVHVSCSTISTALARHLDAEHSAHGQHYMSAPVFGRPEAAEAKKLLVVAAGAPEQVSRCGPVFDAVGRQTFIAGAEPWQANAVKLCGNFMIAAMIESFGEAYATLQKAGVAPAFFLDVMNALFASPVYADYGDTIATERFEPAGFALKLGLKDIGLVLDTAKECASPMPVASIIRDHLLSAMALGQAESDWSSVTRISARNAGLRSDTQP